MYGYRDFEERRFNKPFLVAGVLLVFLAIGFIFYYSNASSTIAAAKSTISNLNNQVMSTLTQLNSANYQASSLGDQLTAANTQIAALKSQVSMDTSQIASLQGQMSSDKGSLASLQTQASAASTQVSSLQSQLTNANSQVTSLQNQLSSANTQISSLQSQVNSLNAQLGTYTGSTTTTQITGSTSIVTNAGGQSLISSFTADTAGYLNITGYGTTATSYIKTINSAYGSSNNYTLSTASSTFSIPVQPGTVSIYFCDPDVSGSATAYISSILYYRGSSSVSTTSQIIGSTAVSASPNGRSLIASFTAEGIGYLNVTGYSAPVVGYIKIANPANVYSPNYTLSTASSTFSIPVQPGTVNIYFYNLDSTNTATASITSIVYSRS